MQPTWINMEFDIYNETFARAYLDIVALLSLSRTSLSAEQVAVLQEWECFKQFPVNQLLQILQKRVIELRREDTRKCLASIANKTFREGQLKAMRVTRKMLSFGGSPLEDEAKTMLHAMKSAFELSDDDISDLLS